MTETIQRDGLRGFLHSPAGVAKAGMVLAHGAGANCHSALLLATANAFAENGYIVLRCDLAFRQRRPTGPPHPSGAAEDRAGLRRAAEFVRERAGAKIVLAGHSYGGRQATILTSEDPAVCDGLMLLSYPLHPPDKPEQLRTAHFPALQTPSLFVHGSRDPFGTPEEMRGALRSIPGRTEFLEVPGAGHDLKSKNLDFGEIARKLDALIGR